MPMPKPKTEGRYLKAPKAGQSVTFRILGDPVEYYLAFKTGAENKIAPVRRANLHDFKPGSYDTTSKFGPRTPDYCQAFPILGPTGDVMVMEIRQKTILDGLFGLENNKKWGDLTTYDVTVTAADDGKSYTVVPDPKAPLSEADAEKWDGLKRNGFDLRLLLDGKDPFKESGQPVNDEIANPNFDGDDSDSIPF